MDRLDRFWVWLRSSPLHMAAVAGVVVAAVVAGVAFGIVFNGEEEPETGAAPSTSPTASVSESASPSTSASPSASASADATPASTPIGSHVESPTPAPTPSPEGGYGGSTGDSFDLTGEWVRLADMPGGDDFHTSDSVILEDGRIAVFRWDYGSEDPAEPEVVVYDREPDSWEIARFADSRPFVGTDQPFALGGDGLIYSFEYRIDPSGDEWLVEPFQLVRETDIWAGTSLTAGGDGRIYRRADDSDAGRTELAVYEPQDDTFGGTSSVAGYFDRPFTAPDGNLVVFGSVDGEAALVEYDIVADRWSSPVAPISDAIDTMHVAIGSDRDAYVPGFYPDIPQLWAIGVDDGTMRSVELPDDVTDWDVDLLWTRDGHLFAFGNEEAWLFTPDE